MPVLAPGLRVLLVDARLCHVEHTIGGLDRVVGRLLILRGQAWARLPFVLTDERTIDGLPVLRAERPAVAGATDAVHLYVPEGWHAPADLPARLGRSGADR